MRRFRTPLAVAFGVLLLDQLTKQWIRDRLEYRETVPLVDGLLNIVHARNPGAAFSFLADAPVWFRAPFFVGISIVAVLVLVYVIHRLPAEDRLMRIALGGVLGGAIGNLIDRLLFGEVTDFIDVHWRGYHWPAFNVADSSITLAVVTVMVHTLFSARPEPARAASGERGGPPP